MRTLKWQDESKSGRIVSYLTTVPQAGSGLGIGVIVRQGEHPKTTGCSTCDSHRPVVKGKIPADQYAWTSEIATHVRGQATSLDSGKAAAVVALRHKIEEFAKALGGKIVWPRKSA